MTTGARALALVKRHGATVFGLLLLGGALYVVQREFRTLSWSDIKGALDGTPASSLWAAAGFTLAAYIVLTAYDRLGSVYAGHPVSYARTSLASFVAYSLANNLGFATVSGAAIRYRFYAAWGLPPLAIAKVVAFTSLTFGLGGFALGGLVLVMQPGVPPFFGEGAPRWAMPAVGVAMWCIVAAYILAARFVSHFRLFGHQIDLPGFRMAVGQTVLASADVAVTALVFWTLLPHADGLTFLHFLGIYVLALSAGIIANVPGGIGVFDGAILIGLSNHLPAPVVIGALLLFRLYYYIVPLFIAGLMFAAFEVSQRRHLMDRIAPERGVAISFEVPAMAALTVLAAMTMILIGALPPKPNALDGVFDVLDDAASHFAASVVGCLLLVAAYGLMRRLAMAWWVALVLLLNGALVVWLRGEPWWLIGGFLLLAGLLTTVRPAFYRRARLNAEPLAAENVAILAGLSLSALTLAGIGYAGPYADLSWWGVVLSAEAPHSLRFAVGLAGVFLLVAAVGLLRPARTGSVPYDEPTRLRLLALGAVAPAVGAADGAMFGEADRAGFAFVKREGIWLALGDPAGEERDRISAIWRFRDVCERAGVDPAFWRAGPGLLRVYADIGLTPFPLQGGDEGALHLLCRPERDIEALLPLLPQADVVP